MNEDSRNFEAAQAEYRSKKIKELFGNEWTEEEQGELNRNLEAYYEELSVLGKIRSEKNQLQQKIEELKKLPDKSKKREKKEPSTVRLAKFSIDLICNAQPNDSVQMMDFYFLHCLMSEALQADPDNNEIKTAAKNIAKHYKEQGDNWKKANEQNEERPLPAEIEITEELQQAVLEAKRILIDTNTEDNELEKSIQNKKENLLKAQKEYAEKLKQLQDLHAELQDKLAPLRKQLTKFQALLYKKFLEPDPTRSYSGDLHPEAEAREEGLFSNWKERNGIGGLVSDTELEGNLGKQSVGNHFDAFVVVKGKPIFIDQWHDALSIRLAIIIASSKKRNILLLSGDRSHEFLSDPNEARKNVKKTLKNYGPAWVVLPEGLLEIPENELKS